MSKLPQKKRKHIARLRYWTFTWNNYPDAWLTFFSMHQHPTGRLHGYACGHAVAPTTGTPHIRGWIDFGKCNKARPSVLNLPKQIIWRNAMRPGRTKDNYVFFSKERIESYVAWGTGIRHSDITDIEHEHLCGKRKQTITRAPRALHAAGATLADIRMNRDDEPETAVAAMEDE